MNRRGSHQPNEQRRYDGAPAPKRNAGITAADAKAMAKEARENATCDHCDSDESWDDLTRVSKHYVHGCSDRQKPPGEPVQLCNDCLEEHDPEQDYIDRQVDDNSTQVRYECGLFADAECEDPPTMEVEETVGYDDNGDPITEVVEIEEPLPYKPTPKAPVKCSCGAEIDEIFYEVSE